MRFKTNNDVVALQIRAALVLADDELLGGDFDAEVPAAATFSVCLVFVFEV